MSYKNEMRQAAVDFKPLADQFGPSVTNSVELLHRMREEVWSAVQQNYQKHPLHPRELSSAEALAKRQQLLLTDIRFIEIDHLAINCEETVANRNPRHVYV